MRLAGADRSGDHDVLAALQVVAGGQQSEVRPLDPARRVPVDLVLVHGLEVGEGRSGHESSDGAYRRDQTQQLARGLRYRPVVPPPGYRNPSWPYDRALYRRCNEGKRFSCCLKRFRPIATRYDKLDVALLSFIHLALIWDALQLL